jgi:hypothetical protein
MIESGDGTLGDIGQLIGPVVTLASNSSLYYTAALPANAAKSTHWTCFVVVDGNSDGPRCSRVWSAPFPC